MRPRYPVALMQSCVRSRAGSSAAVAEEGSGRQQQQRQTTTAADDNGMQDRLAEYNGEGQEQAVRDGRDMGVAMTAALVEDGGGRQQRRRQRMKTDTADDDSGGRHRWRITIAHKIGLRTTRKKEESRQQTTTAFNIRLISPPGREREKINKSRFTKKYFI
jgi:hypothetical protein